MTSGTQAPAATATLKEASVQKKGNKKFWIWTGILGFILLEIWMGQYVHPSMVRVTEHPRNLETFWGWKIPFGGVNVGILLNTWLIMGVMIVLALLGRFGLKATPGRRQGIFEVILSAFDGLCKESLGERLGRRFLPYIVTLFFFIMLCNWMLLFYAIPGIEEPTLNLNTTVALGTIAFVVAHATGIREKGLKAYIAHYFEPMIEIGPVKLPNIFFFPLHLIGEVGKVVSHSFRLFGNILGGAIIYIVVTALIRHMVLPPFLHLFFGIFIGVIQAFVFTLLALTYISIQAAHSGEEESH
jgi:F-type H+-transporting ATPase subunit a